LDAEGEEFVRLLPKEKSFVFLREKRKGRRRYIAEEATSMKERREIGSARMNIFLS